MSIVLATLVNFFALMITWAFIGMFLYFGFWAADAVRQKAQKVHKEGFSMGRAFRGFPFGKRKEEPSPV